MCCSFVIPFFVFGIFQQSYPISTYEGLSDVLLFCDSFLYVWLRYFQQSLPNFYLKAGLSDVLLLCDSFLLFGLKSIFQQSHFLPMKAGLSDVLLFCDSFLYVWS
jgi:hypothetical protein